MHRRSGSTPVLTLGYLARLSVRALNPYPRSFKPWGLVVGAPERRLAWGERGRGHERLTTGGPRGYHRDVTKPPLARTNSTLTHWSPLTFTRDEGMTGRSCWEPYTSHHQRATGCATSGSMTATS